MSRNWIIVLSVVAIAIFVLMHKFECKSILHDEFELNYSFSETKRLLVINNAMERIVEANNGKIIERNTNINIDLNNILRKDRQVKTDGHFKVAVHNEDLGELILNYSQKVDIDEHQIKIFSHLDHPAGNIREQGSGIIITRLSDKKTGVTVMTTLKVQKHIPKMFSEYAKNKVEAANAKTLNNIKNCLLTLSTIRIKM